MLLPQDMFTEIKLRRTLRQRIRDAWRGVIKRLRNRNNRGALS